MDKTDLGLIGKVFLFSFILSAIIKYTGPFVSFAPSNLNALIAISLPPVVILIMLLRRLFSSGSDLTQKEN